MDLYHEAGCYWMNNVSKIFKEAESNKCYKILSLSKKFYNSNNVMMNEWEHNFEQIFNERKLTQGDSLNLREL